MATMLKNLELTSVDLVRAGANQEADICLYKSADPQEATEAPTEQETNIFKRFINWLRENPTEDEEEPENAVEKTDYMLEPTDIFKSAIIESLQSIVADDSLSTAEKNDMIEKSIDQYHAKMLEVEKSDEDLSYLTEGLEKSDNEEVLEKHNPYHAADGKFTTANGGGGAARSISPAARAMVDSLSDKDKDEIRGILNGGEDGGGSPVSILFGSGEGFAGRIPQVNTGKGKKGETAARKLLAEARSKAKEYKKDPRGLGLAINGKKEWLVQYIGGNGYFGKSDRYDDIEEVN